jgi:hypothetical protein
MYPLATMLSMETSAVQKITEDTKTEEKAILQKETKATKRFRLSG